MTFQKEILPNGLRLVLAPKADSLATTILVMVETGSLYEDKINNGVAHFLEHMCFKGTTKRPTPQAIAEELDGLGSNYNAFTSQEYTGYYATVEPRKCAQALDIVADMYLNPTLPSAEIAKEQGVVIEEINMYRDLPNNRVSRLMRELLYGDQPAGRSVLGTKETVTSLNREAISDFRERFYLASRTVVVVTGKFDEVEVKQAVNDYFSQLPLAESAPRLAVTEEQKEPKLAIDNKESDQVHLRIAFRGVPVEHPDYYAYEVLSAVLGGGMSSRLFKKVRDELGAAYYVHSYNDSYTDHGIFGVACGANQAKTLAVVEAVLAECAKLKQELVGEQELTRAKDSMTGGIMLGLETSQQLAMYFGGDEVLRQPLLLPEAIVAKIQAVTAADLKRIAGDLFLNSKLNLAIVGPIADPAAFEKALIV